MKREHWEIFKKAARLERLDNIPMAMIIDSPWIPGYVGVKHMDFYLDPQVWFQSHLKIHKEFPDIMFVPGWWWEYGMAAEPSVFGSKIKFWSDNTPSEYHMLFNIEDMDKFPEYEVENDAFMAMTLHRIRSQRQRVLDTGEILPFVTTRGPMCTAGFVRSTTDFMIDLVEKPEWAHKLLDLCTRMIIDWLKAQAKAMGPTVEGIFVLDDIVGFVNEDHYLEFCHPYLKRICDAFPKDFGSSSTTTTPRLTRASITCPMSASTFSTGASRPISPRSRPALGIAASDRMCLMGNVNPLEVGVRGTPAGGPRRRHARCPPEERRHRRHPLRRRRHQSRHAPRQHPRHAGCVGRIQRRPRPRLRPQHLEITTMDYALMNQYLYEGKAKEVGEMTTAAPSRRRAPLRQGGARAGASSPA